MHKITDMEVLNRMNEMCVESCSPDLFEAWEKLQAHLLSVRSSLKEAENPKTQTESPVL